MIIVMLESFISRVHISGSHTHFYMCNKYDYRQLQSRNIHPILLGLGILGHGTKFHAAKTKQ